MQFHEKFLELYRKFYSTRHAFSSSNIAFLSLMASDQKRKWKPRDFEEAFGLSYIGARQTLQRLKIEGYVTSEGVITGEGLDAVGFPVHRWEYDQRSKSDE